MKFFQKFLSIIDKEYSIDHTEKFDLSFKQLDEDFCRYRKYTGYGYDVAGFSVELLRSPTPFFVNTYLPTTILTLVSFIGFLIPVGKEEGRRVALLITILLMMVTISGIQQQNGPVVCEIMFSPSIGSCNI